jgi:hypothetical protein
VRQLIARQSRAHIGLVPLLLTLVLLSACSAGGDAGAPTPTPTLADASASPEGSPAGDRIPCYDGNLLIQDLSAIDGLWGPGLEAAYQIALTWHDDARLVGFRVTCELFEPGFRWQATYYSEEAQALYSTDTRESTPIDLDPDEVASLDVSQLSFHEIRQALLSYDYPDDTVLQPSTGVDVRVNTIPMPFGPPEAPLGHTVAHVSLEFRGEVKDLFIGTATSEIFQFASPAR